jgi:hypothetical protein
MYSHIPDYTLEISINIFLVVLALEISIKIFTDIKNI